MTDYEQAEILEIERAIDSQEAQGRYPHLYEAGWATVRAGGFDIDGNWHANTD